MAARNHLRSPRSPSPISGHRQTVGHVARRVSPAGADPCRLPFRVGGSFLFRSARRDFRGQKLETPPYPPDLYTFAVRLRLLRLLPASGNCPSSEGHPRLSWLNYSRPVDLPPVPEVLPRLAGFMAPKLPTLACVARTFVTSRAPLVGFGRASHLLPSSSSFRLARRPASPGLRVLSGPPGGEEGEREARTRCYLTRLRCTRLLGISATESVSVVPLPKQDRTMG
jgi:hypothetical protein